MAKKSAVSKRTGRGSDQFPLRLPDGMRKLIADIAEQTGFSMNAVIIEALEMSLDRVERDPSTAQLLARIDALEERLGDLHQRVRSLEGKG